MRLGPAITSFLLLGAPGAWAMPIATEAALPVAKGQGVLRVKTTVNSTSRLTTHLGAIAYGLHGNTAIIGAVPFQYAPLNTGLGDVALVLRQTLFQRDTELQTLRFAVLAGLELPSWRDDFSSKNLGAKAGAVFTFQTARHEVDADLIYTGRVPAAGFKKGDSLVYDLAYQVRIYPIELPGDGIPSFWNLDIELNGLYETRDAVAGVGQAATGGNRLFLSPGIQWISDTWVVEGLYQFPVLNRLNSGTPGHQLQLSIRTLF